MKLNLTNQNYCGTVAEIKTIIPLDNCDNLVHTNIFGNLVIVSKDTKVGDIGIFFPVETKLSKEYLSHNNLYRNKDLNVNDTAGYFEEHGRIKAVKLRGNSSNGLLMPLSSLEFLGKVDLKIGDEFNEIDRTKICEKYVIKISQNQGSGKKGKSAKVKRESKVIDEQFKYHYDTAQLGKNIHLLHPDDFISCTLKGHGTSSIFSNVLIKKKLSFWNKIGKLLGFDVNTTEYGNLYSSRRVIKNEYFDDKKEYQHYYKEDIWGLANKRFIEQCPLPKGMSVYAEIVGYTPEGSPIQGDFDYGCEVGQFEIYVYRITYTNIDGVVYEFTPRQVQEFCKSHGVKAVPELYYGKAKDLFPEIPTDTHWNENFLSKLQEKYLEGDSVMCKNKVPEEGIVLKIDGRTDAFKLKSERFYQYESKFIDSGKIDMESGEE